MNQLAAVVGVVVISFSAIFVRLAAVSPDTAAFFRCAWALPALGLIVVWRRRHGDKAVRFSRTAFLAGILFGLDLAFWHRAIEWIGAGLATVLGNTQVLFVGLAAWLLHGERPDRAMLAALPLALLGVVLVSGLGSEQAYGDAPIFGVVFGIFTGIAYASFLLVFRVAGRGETATARLLLDATLGAGATALVVGLGSGDLDWQVRFPEHGWLIALALGSQVIGWLLIAYALPRLPAIETSVLLLLQPALTILWAALLFEERLAPVQWLGASLVLGGIGLASLVGAVRKAEAGVPIELDRLDP